MSWKKIFIIILLAPVALILFYYSLSHIYSNLPVASLTEKDDENFKPFSSSTPEESKAHDEWFRKNKWSSGVNDSMSYPFPNHSPNGKFYVSMRYQPVMELWIMEMYRTTDNRLLGTYASHRLSFDGWRPDSSGVYVRRLGMSHGGGFISIGPNFDRPLVVALVPPQEMGIYRPLFWNKLVLVVCILIFITFLWYYSLSHVHTSLTTVLLTPADNRELEGMPAKYRWSSKSRKASIFPLVSPDGRFYITMNHKPLLRLWIMEMYRSSGNGILGTYASHHMEFAGWRSDSSRLYVRRAGSRWLNLGGPMKAVMVPPQEYVSSKNIE